MPTRRRLTWIVFAVCALAVLEGLGFVTWHAGRLARREREARADARLQEAVILALWRMDSELTPIIAGESRRPYFEYRSFYNPERAYTRMWQELQPGEVRVKSELLDAPGPFIRLHFEIQPDGSVTSPQAPTGNMRDLAESWFVDGEFIVYSTGLLDELSAMVRAPQTTVAGRDVQESSRLAFGAVRPEGVAGPRRLQTEGDAETMPQALAADAVLDTEKALGDYEQRQQAAQQAFNLNEPASKSNRNRAAPPQSERLLKAESAKDRAELDALDGTRQPAITPAPGAAPATREGDLRGAGDGAPKEQTDLGAKLAEVQPAPLAHDEVEQLGFEPAWFTNPSSGEPELVLRRTVRVDQQTVTQGFWLDWPAIRVRLVERVRDLLPDARVTPYAGPPDGAPRSRMLASVPVVLDPGALAAPPAPGLGAASITLAVTWLAVIAAIAAIGVVLRAAMALSDRRGRFVSAVTHELRTPLTTFCLYTEMLADGMVKDDDSKRTYLGTLKGESRRLARIVENVLDYARLGQGRTQPNGGAAPIGAGELLARSRPVLERRAGQDGMTLEFDAGDFGDARCAADPQSIERILYNLVDNACKYAGEATDRRVHVSARLAAADTRGRAGDVLEVVVRDHGPGIPPSERRRVFKSFHRARRDEQGPKSGLGLGLALSRGLARELGGDLELVESDGGATLRLTIPVAHPVPGGVPR
ncbi:MAG: sensor histidine kinase [Phycisphaerales bacterium]